MTQQSNVAIATYAESLVGHPCLTGAGTLEGGFGAFSFVRHVVEHASKWRFPASPSLASDVLQSVDVGEARPGDLVYFNTGTKPYSHVGVLLSGGAFAHVLGKCGTVEYGSILRFRWRSILSGVRRIPPSRITDSGTLTDCLS